MLKSVWGGCQTWICRSHTEFSGFKTLDFERDDPVQDKDILLVMTICDLLEKPTSPHAVELAYQRAKSSLERWRQRMAQSNPDRQ